MSNEDYKQRCKIIECNNLLHDDYEYCNYHLDELVTRYKFDSPECVALGCSNLRDEGYLVCSKHNHTPPGTEALKQDDNKVRMELLSPIALTEIAKVLTFGAKKYADHNWRKGFAWSRLLGAAMRHLLAFLSGQDKDPETGLSHLAHLGATVIFLLEHEVTHIDKDDRYKT